MKARSIAILLSLAMLTAACSGAKSAKQAADDQVSAGETTTTVADGAGATDTTLPDGQVSTGPTAPGGPAGGTAKPKPGQPGSTSGSGGGSATGSGGGSAAAPSSTLFSGKDDTIGITKDSITMCADAALTYGPAFDTEVKDLNVYWDAINDEQGGVYGRKVTVTYENDNYDPQTAVQAATACKARNPFILLGGIGFDQIPAVRNWAEQNKVLYVHHIATIKGSEGKKFSYTPLPTVEKLGEIFAELMIKRYTGKKVGIIKRNSPNWEPGIESFKALAKKANVKVVAERSVNANQANYTQEVLDMRNAGAEIVFAWENALGATQMITQAKGQGYSPTWLLFPFNLTSQTLGDNALNPKLIGVATWAAYSYGDTSGPFAAYASDIKEFERQYAKYDPDANLGGPAGDLLFLNWQAQKAMHAWLLDCGKSCTRNRMVDVLTGYKKTPVVSGCMVDFSRGDGHHGGYSVNLLETYRAPSNQVNWRHTDTCIEHVK